MDTGSIDRRIGGLHRKAGDSACDLPPEGSSIPRSLDALTRCSRCCASGRSPIKTPGDDCGSAALPRAATPFVRSTPEHPSNYRGAQRQEPNRSPEHEEDDEADEDDDDGLECLRVVEDLP